MLCCVVCARFVFVFKSSKNFGAFGRFLWVIILVHYYNSRNYVVGQTRPAYGLGSRDKFTSIGIVKSTLAYFTNTHVE